MKTRPKTKKPKPLHAPPCRRHRGVEGRWHRGCHREMEHTLPFILQWDEALGRTASRSSCVAVEMFDLPELCNRARHVASALMDGARHLPRRSVRAALGLESASCAVVLAEAAVPVLGEGRMVGNIAVEPEAAEPAVGQIEVDLLAQAPLGADAEAVAHDQHPDHQLGSTEGRPMVL